jgi:predicted nucleic acid-binding protein
MADARLDLVRDIPLLEITERVAALTTELLAKQIVPTKASSDAVHIAVAAVHGLEFLVTWNFKHIANPHIRERLRREVTAFGANLPVICTPDELLDEDD